MLNFVIRRNPLSLLPMSGVLLNRNETRQILAKLLTMTKTQTNNGRYAIS
ncbi:MAG: hypothetical protein Q4F69_11425 [Bacteroidia bacterium]|nr:hypothetical protein [Bacteroidia bacterium]